MIEAIVEVIFTIVGEIILQVVAELFFNLGLGTIGNTLKRKKRANPFMAGVGFIILGSITGLFVSWLLPERIVPGVDLHGLSVLLAAAGTGTVMMFYGRWQTSLGKQTTYLATFWGGGLFAFSMALTRWLLVRG